MTEAKRPAGAGGNAVHIDVDKIPEFVRNKMADLALQLTESRFSQPGEEEKYQAWLAAREAKSAERSTA